MESLPVCPSSSSTDIGQLPDSKSAQGYPGAGAGSRPPLPDAGDSAAVYISMPMPPPGAAGSGVSAFGSSAMDASVVRNSAATEAAF
jgi:hypothetical protein